MYCHKERMSDRKVVTVILSLVSLFLHITECAQKPNVLFLMVDDLRPNIEILRDDHANGFKQPFMHTPNLDNLARKSLVLKQAYVQQAVCAPSRTSLLTGRRPETTRVNGFDHYWREHSGNFTTIPQYFKENGYTSIGMGKIFHPKQSSNNNDPISWSVPYFKGSFHHEDKTKIWNAIPDERLVDKPLVDQEIADKAIEHLNKLAANKDNPNNKPFFLAVGFNKPHAPYIFPRSMLDKYPVENISLPDNPYAPEGMPGIAWKHNNIFTIYKDIRKRKLSKSINATISDQVVLDLRRAYYCSLSWADQQLGRVLNELDRLGYTDNTIIVFLSDHGYSLGEHGLWTKYTNFELALRTPLMIHIPGRTLNSTFSDQIVEFVDLFPTIVEAAGFEPLPLCPRDSSATRLCREGTSFLSLLSKPEVSLRKAAFSIAVRHHGKAMGYSIKTTRYRYTVWMKFNPKKNTPRWRKRIGVELYDHVIDPEENRNVAGNPAYAKTQAELQSVLRKGWRKALYN